MADEAYWVDIGDKKEEVPFLMTWDGEKFVDNLSELAFLEQPYAWLKKVTIEELLEM